MASKRAVWTEELVNDFSEAMAKGLNNKQARSKYPSLKIFTSAQLSSKKQQMVKTEAVNELKQNIIKTNPPVKSSTKRISPSSSDSELSDSEPSSSPLPHSKKRKRSSLLPPPPSTKSEMQMEEDIIWDFTQEDEDDVIPLEQTYLLTPKRKLPWIFLEIVRPDHRLQAFRLVSFQSWYSDCQSPVQT